MATKGSGTTVGENRFPGDDLMKFRQTIQRLECGQLWEAKDLRLGIVAYDTGLTKPISETGSLTTPGPWNLG